VKEIPMAETAQYSPGLEGVIAGETSICSIDEEGLAYRGYGIADLVRHCSFDQVALLLLKGELPSEDVRKSVANAVKEQRALSAELKDLVRRIPTNIHPMDALRTAISLQSHFEPEIEDGSHDANLRKTLRLIAQAPALIAEWHWARSGKPAPEARDNSHAGYMLHLITGREPDTQATRVFDASLILYAEHEYNASTFAARVTVSTLSDLHSGVISAVGALKGPLHGGANEEAIRMLLEVGSADQAEAWVMDRLARKERIMGFGHRVVRSGDLRAGILRELGIELAKARGEERWVELADTIQSTVEREKGLKPNVDFPCGWVYHLLGIPTDLYTPIFVCARLAGWCAHIIEQLDNNRLIRPRGLYVGPERRTVPD
jgi:2-methylcitrate synthase/citrate synthase II